MSDQPSTGATEALPGGDADPRTAALSSDERDETVATPDVAPPDGDGEDADVR